MKKKIIGIALMLMLAFSLCIPSFAADVTPEETSVEMHYVIDTYGLLSFDECTALEKMAANISEQYSCGVYIVTVDDYKNYGYGDVYDVTTQIYHSGIGFGVGDGRDGIMLLLSMKERDYALFVYGGKAEYTFSDYCLEQLENAFLGDLGNDDWYGGSYKYLRACGQYLASAQEGRPVRANHTGRIIISVLISCVIALVICMTLKGQMNTVHNKIGAREYIAADGLHLTKQVDQYTYTTRTSRKIENRSGRARSGGGGHGRSHSGGGGHGRSGKF